MPGECSTQPGRTQRGGSRLPSGKVAPFQAQGSDAQEIRAPPEPPGQHTGLGSFGPSGWWQLVEGLAAACWGWQWERTHPRLGRERRSAAAGPREDGVRPPEARDAGKLLPCFPCGL